MYNRILLPTNGIQADEPAVEHAVELAHKMGADLHILFVTEDTYIPKNDNLVNKEFQTPHEETFGAIREKADAWNVNIIEDIRKGLPHETILEYADQNNIDIIVMSPMSPKKLTRFLLGSITGRVIETADIPVLTVRATSD